MIEIVRKFFPKTIPNLKDVQPTTSCRYILFKGSGIELRIQKVDDRYELERKVEDGDLSRATFLCPLSVDEFELLKSLATKSIVRDSYILQSSPEIALRIYHGEYEGLIRLEIEFDSLDEAKNFAPPDWYGVEITDSPLGRDGKLFELRQDQVVTELNRVKGLLGTETIPADKL